MCMCNCMHMSGFYPGSNVWGEPTHQSICTYTCTHDAVYYKHDVVYSMILKPHSCMQHAYQVFFHNNDEDEAMANYSDVRNGRQICMWNDSGLS